MDITDRKLLQFHLSATRFEATYPVQFFLLDEASLGKLSSLPIAGDEIEECGVGGIRVLT